MQKDTTYKFKTTGTIEKVIVIVVEVWKIKLQNCFSMENEKVE
jgi:hypothetical protein